MVTRVEVTYIRHFDEAISGSLDAPGMKEMAEVFEQWLESVLLRSGARIEEGLKAKFGELIQFERPALKFTHAFERPTTTGSAT